MTKRIRLTKSQKEMLDRHAALGYPRLSGIAFRKMFNQRVSGEDGLVTPFAAVCYRYFNKQRDAVKDRRAQSEES